MNLEKQIRDSISNERVKQLENGKPKKTPAISERHLQKSFGVKNC